MAKGVITALAVMLVCTIVPIAQAFGPFLGAYFGIRSVPTGDRAPLLDAAIFGFAVAAASAAILVIVAVIVTFATPIPGRFIVLTWIAVAVFSAYVAGMSTLGGLYRLMKSRTTAGASASEPD